MAPETVYIDGYEIKLSNLSKILFPQSKITKGDIIEYYQRIANTALPYYKNRLLTVTRAPDAISKQTFIQKQIPKFYPYWIDKYEVIKKNGRITHILPNKKATFVYLANQGCITFHLSLSTTDKINYPDRLIFDLDPSSNNIKLLKFVALKVQDLANALNLVSFIQTTGSRGFHIYIPLDQSSPFQEVHSFARRFADYLVEQYPDKITIEQRIENRGNKVFIDYARNSYGLTAVAPYSVRTQENAPIATPFYWDELENESTRPQSFNIQNIFTRLENVRDPWADMKNHAYSLEKVKDFIK